MVEAAQVPQNVRIVVVDLSTGVKVVIEEDIIVVDVTHLSTKSTLETN